MLLLCLAMLTVCKDTATPKQITYAKTTGHEMTTDARGDVVMVTYAEQKDEKTGKMTYYKKLQAKTKPGMRESDPITYSRHSKTEQWQLLNHACPIPKVKHGEGIDNCEQGWRIGKAVATMAAYLGMQKAEDTVEHLISQNKSHSVAHDRQKRQRTKQAVIETSHKILEGLQGCVKRTLKDSGFNLKRVCLQKALVTEGKTILESFKNHGADPKMNCDYLALKQNGHCVPHLSLKTEPVKQIKTAPAKTTRKNGKLGA